MASLLLLLVAATAALAAPPPLSGRAAQAELADTIPGGSGPTLAELAAAQGLQPPPRRSPRVARHAPRVGRAALDGLGASASPYPFGLADPEPPRRYKEPSSVPDEISAQAEFEDADLLPARVVPTRYTVQMAPQIEKGTFYGSTDIYLNVVEATSQIILHAVDINVKEVQIFLYSPDFEKYFGYGEARIYPQASGSHRLVIQLTRELQPGDHYLLRFPLFAANLRDDLQGFYLSSYKDAKGATRYLATTQFQPPAARYAFPCIDEPAVKARFKIIVEHDVSMHARSNMPAVRRTRPTLTTIRTEFDQTVPMSTYLLAWIVSDFVDLPSSDSSIITWGRPNLITSTTAFLGSRAAPLALRKLEEFTGIAYVLPKVDQYAIPDFAAGAMENWGLVTYGEQYLLETDETNIAIRQFIGTTVCHELGHQWTGNLVTLDWWSNTWLNEGFATYFESVICDQVFPEWKLLDKYVTDNTHVAIANDIYPDQLAMSSPVHSIPAIEAKFDRISYKKGGAVVRMFEFILGTEVFKKGMLRYLSAYSFSYGTPDRLFRSFNAEAKLAGSLLPDGVSFADMAKTWTEQNGVPVVTALRDYKSSTVTLSQEQFLYQRPKSHVDNLWYIPVPVEANPHSKEWTWSLEDAPANRRWLTPAAPSMTRDVDASATEWIVINPKQIGYYLVNYDEANWELLRTALTEPRPLIPASSRAQLLHDALALARAGRLRYALALPILHSLKREREAAPWKAGVQALAFLRDRLGATPAGDVLKVFIKQLTSDAHSDLGFSPSKTVAESYKDLQTDEERLVRYYVSSYACYARNEQCIKAASQQFAAAIKNTETKIHPDVKQTALCYAVQNSAEHFAEALAKWESETDFAAISEWSQVLSCTLDHSLLQKILDDILSGKVNKSSMHFQILIGALVTRWENHDFLVKFYKANWKKIDQLVGDNFHLELLTVLIRDIRTTADYVDMMTFIMAAFPDGNSLERLEATARLEAVYEDLEWYRKYYTVVSEWLYAATNTKPQVSTEAPTQKPPPQPTQGTTPRPIMTTPQGVPSTTPSSSSHTTSTISLLAMSALALLLSL